MSTYCSSRLNSTINYLQVNALSECIVGIYLHEFTNDEREISIPHDRGFASAVLEMSSSLLMNCTKKSSNFE